MGEFANAKGKFESRYLDANGVRTHYLEAGSGPPLLLIHGGGAGADSFGNWYSSIPEYAKAFHVIAVDLLGFGQTGGPDPATFVYSQDARNDHMIAFIDALKLGPVSIIGNSMGGATTIGVCVKRPDLVRKVVLMGSAGLRGEMNPALLPLINYNFTREGMVAICRALANKDFSIDDDMITYRLESSLQPQVRVGYSATMGWVKQNGLFYEEDFIRKVQTPCLITSGKQDPVVPLDHAFRFLQLIENSWGYILPHCGHWAMLEYPKDFTSETIRFLST